MARKRNLLPTYSLHKATGRGRMTWTDALGIRHEKLLPGAYNSAESLEAKTRLELEVVTSPVGAVENDGISLAELMLAFLEHARQHYRREDGTPTHEVDEYKLTIRHVRELYGETPAAKFGPLMLKAVRQRFIDAGWCRTLVNQRVGRVRRMFKWAASEELVPVAVPQALATVQGLQRGRSKVRESEPVEPVADAVVDATLPFLNRHVRGLVEFQRLTGCRPGEACRIRRCDIDTGGAVWLYKPAAHKTAWRGKTRTISIGPKAQALLREFFTPDISDYLFSPARAVEELHAERGKNRKTPRYPSHLARNAKVRKAKPQRKPADLYDVNAYGHAIDRACDKAFPLPERLAPRSEGDGRTESEREWWGRLNEKEREEVGRWRKARRWHPNQLRHSYATKVRKEHGLEAAQVLLGHSRADVTQVYAERNETLAAVVAAKIG